MECISGKIVNGDTTLAADVEFWIAHGTTDDDWNGTVELPPGVHVDTDATYRIELKDGRSGPARITNVGAPDDTKHAVGFRGAGPLA
jgi:hypothetical protein